MYPDSTDLIARELIKLFFIFILFVFLFYSVLNVFSIPIDATISPKFDYYSFDISLKSESNNDTQINYIKIFSDENGKMDMTIAFGRSEENIKISLHHPNNVIIKEISFASYPKSINESIKFNYICKKQKSESLSNAKKTYCDEFIDLSKYSYINFEMESASPQIMPHGNFNFAIDPKNIKNIGYSLIVFQSENLRCSNYCFYSANKTLDFFYHEEEDKAYYTISRNFQEPPDKIVFSLNSIDLKSENNREYASNIAITWSSILLALFMTILINKIFNTY